MDQPSRDAALRELDRGAAAAGRRPLPPGSRRRPRRDRARRPGRRVVFVNAEVERLFRCRQEELVGQPVELLVPEAARSAHEAHRAGYVAAPRARPMGLGLVLRGRRKDGAEFPVEVSLSPLEHPDGGAAIAVVRDMSAHEAARAEGQRLAAEHAAAEAAVRARDEFVAVAAHDLRTPVASVRGFAQLLLRQLDRPGGVDAERLRTVTAPIDRETGRLAALIGRLLDLSRLERGPLALDRSEVDPIAPAERVATGARTLHPARDVVVRATGQITAVVDPVRVEQLVTNLIDNAPKYAPSPSPVEIEVDAPAPDTARIAARDYGPGVPPEQRARLFERFYRAPGEQAGGLGLGLYISRAIVAEHGGAIAVETPEGGGARFVVLLPREPDRQGPDVPPAP